MKLYVLGSCHALTIVKCISLMNPHLDIESIRPDADLSTLAAADDVIFLERHVSVTAKRDDAIVFPHVVFSAFHPDLVYVFTRQGTPLMPPLGHVQSSLVFYAWQKGLSVARTVRLFTEPVFEHLKFFGRWESARHALLNAGVEAAFPLDAMFARWERRGLFMHLPNHPKLFVVADIARELLRRAKLPSVLDNPEDYFADPLYVGPVWPVYPEVAARLNLSGSYAFKAMQTSIAEQPTVLNLEDFIVASFAAYAPYSRSDLTCERLANPAYRNLEALVTAAPRAGAPRAAAAEGERREDGGASPYAGLPDARFWRRAVANVEPGMVDPVGKPPFTIDRTTRVATAGSCFAAHMARVLTSHGYNFYVAERAPEHLRAADAATSCYGIFSARYGNIYTARQLLQLFDRAHGDFVPEEPAWRRADGRFVDPFRARVEPKGFGSSGEVLVDRERHLRAVRRMFAELDVFIFTLGITEAWRAKADGAVFSMAPGVAGGALDRSRHEFYNFAAAEVTADLQSFLHRLAAVNPKARVVLTVSPHPPIATFENRHVLISATYSKAVLRVAAQEIEQQHERVWYFPGYEIIAGTQARGEYYGPNLRSVTSNGVDHVMRLFFKHVAPSEAMGQVPDAALTEENRKLMDALCDDDAIENVRP